MKSRDTRRVLQELRAVELAYEFGEIGPSVWPSWSRSELVGFMIHMYYSADAVDPDEYIPDSSYLTGWLAHIIWESENLSSLPLMVSDRYARQEQDFEDKQFPKSDNSWDRLWCNTP